MLERDTLREDDEFEKVTEEAENNDIEVDEFEDLTQDKIKSLRSKLKECEAQKAEHLEELQRVRADFLNSKRRVEEQAKRDSDRGREDMLISLLPIIDSFYMAMADREAWGNLDEKWRRGMEGVYAQLLGFLRSYNVEETGEVGTAFDPNIHEAVGGVEVDEKQVDTVVSVLQKGFKRNGTILRPARVIVGTQK